MSSLKGIFIVVLLFSCTSNASNGFIDNSDGTVSDVISGLMWQKAKPAAPLTFLAATQACEDITLGGYLNWRLPEVKELLSIVDYKRSDPAINTIFFPGTSGNYWMQSSDYGALKRRVFHSAYGRVSELIEAGNPYYEGALNYRCVRFVSSF